MRPFSPRSAAILVALAVPFFAACARDSQQQAVQPQPQYTATAYPTQTAYATTQPTAYGTATTPAAATAPAAAPTFPFGLQLPTNLPALIPSGLIPGFPAAAPTTT